MNRRLIALFGGIVFLYNALVGFALGAEPIPPGFLPSNISMVGEYIFIPGEVKSISANNIIIKKRSDNKEESFPIKKETDYLSCDIFISQNGIQTSPEKKISSSGIKVGDSVVIMSQKRKDNVIRVIKGKLYARLMTLN